jgi:predicted nucleic acid-binding protein
MSYWDSSALVKLYVKEADSPQFEALALVDPLVTGTVGLHEARVMFRRREAEGVIPPGQGAALFAELSADVAAGEIREQRETDLVRVKFGEVLEACFSQTPPAFIRTNDALHIASSLVAGEGAFVTADARQRAAAVLMNHVVPP